MADDEMTEDEPEATAEDVSDEEAEEASESDDPDVEGQLRYH